MELLPTHKLSSQALRRVEVGNLHLHPRRFLAQKHVYLVPKLRSRSPRPCGGKGVIVSLGIPVGDHYEPVVCRLYEEHRAFVSGLPFGGRLHFLAPEPDRFVEVAWLHRVVDQCSVHLPMAGEDSIRRVSPSMYAGVWWARTAPGAGRGWSAAMLRRATCRPNVKEEE